LGIIGIEKNPETCGLHPNDPSLYEGINYRQLADEFLDATVNRFGVDNNKVFEVFVRAFGAPLVRYLSREVTTRAGKTVHAYDHSPCLFPPSNYENVRDNAYYKLDSELHGHSIRTIIENKVCLYRNPALRSIGAYVEPFPTSLLPEPDCGDLEQFNPFTAIPYTQCMKILEPEFGGNSKTNPATPGDWNKWMAARTVCSNFFE
jgi:hypothetical protein